MRRSSRRTAVGTAWAATRCRKDSPVMCLCRSLAEDNARFILLAVLLIAYMLAGAVLFQKLESDLEIQQAVEFRQVYHAFRKHHLRDGPLALQGLHELLYAYGNASATGIINKRRRWDFPGSFHFVGTIVSTIGYGSIAPQSTAGKVAVILYGFFGCSGGNLFFNLFLERIITFLAWILRSWHVRRLKRRLRRIALTSRRASKSQRAQKPSLPATRDNDENIDLDQWKPSVFWVLLYLCVMSCIITCCAAALYAPLEGWDYLDALYFTFVSFTTIGFGDYVSTQQPTYPYEHWYRFANFIFLVMGCCCMYALLNVTSIVIKQGLNYLIRKLRYGNRNVAAPYLPRRRSSVSTMYCSKRRTTRRSIQASEDNAAAPRRMSGELISMKDFLSANKVSLTVMQKQLYDAAHRGNDGSLVATPKVLREPGAVGPLAIVSEKFDSKSTINR